MGIEQTVGRLEAGQQATTDRLDRMELTLAGQDEKLDKLLAYHNQRKGAHAVSKVALSIVGSGGFMGWIWEHFHK